MRTNTNSIQSLPENRRGNAFQLTSQGQYCPDNTTRPRQYEKGTPQAISLNTDAKILNKIVANRIQHNMNRSTHCDHI